MVVLTVLSYIGTISAFVFLTMAVASGLYYLSEQVEENTVWTKKLLTRTIYAIISIHILLLIFDGFPFLLTVGSIITHLLYLQNLNRFPFIQLSNTTFIASCVAVLLNHWLWFRYFSDPSIPPAIILLDHPEYDGPTHPPFSQVASFFGICVWLIPFSLFISLSAGDNVLPTSYDTSEEDESGAAKARRRSAGLAKVAVEWLYKIIADIGRVFGYEIDTGHGPII